MPRTPDLVTLAEIAAALNIDHSTAYRRAKRYGVQPVLQTAVGDLYRRADLAKIAKSPKVGRPTGTKRKGAK